MAENISKNPPKGKIKFDIVLSDEQKSTKTAVLYHPYNFIMGKAGSGKTLLAVQVALDQYFKRQFNKINEYSPEILKEKAKKIINTAKEKAEQHRQEAMTEVEGLIQDIEKLKKQKSSLMENIKSTAKDHLDKHKGGTSNVHSRNAD